MTDPRVEAFFARLRRRRAAWLLTARVWVVS